MNMILQYKADRAGWARLALGAVFAAALAVATPAPAEDCIPFNYNNVQSQLINGTWKVVDGNMWMMDFGTSQANANRARDVIKHYKMTSQCFIGRGVAPKPIMYYKVGSGFPKGSMSGQDGLDFNPWNAWPYWTGSSWQVRDCGVGVGDVGNDVNLAWDASNMIYYNHLRTKVYIGGRANAGMTYFLEDDAYRPSVSLPVTLRSQETSQWCWAASGKMAMEFLGKVVQECTQANDLFGRTDCCNIKLCPNPAGSEEACVSPGWPQFAKYGFTSNTVNSAMSWEDLWTQFSCKRKPVAFSWAWVGGGGHMMIARGARVNADGSYMVQINDPLNPCAGNTRWITYDAYISQAGSYNHMSDIYDITKGG